MKEKDKKDWLEKISLAEKLETPFVLTDLDVVIQKAKDFKALMPRVGIYYAMKSNNDLHIIKALDSYVDGFDISSNGELQIMNELQVAPTRLVYSHPMKVPEHIREAFKNGVNYFAFDSLCEVEKLKAYAPGSTVYLRVKVADYGSKFPLSGKFGTNPEDARILAEMAAKAGLQVKGLTFHVGSQAENTQVWDVAFKTAHRVIEDLKLAGINIDFLNIGGGFPAIYEGLAPTIKDAAQAINHAIDKYMPDDVHIFAEPGRYISANACIMGTTVIGRENRNGTDWLYLDMGAFQGLMESLFLSGWKYPVFTANIKAHQGDKKSFVLTGPTCDPHDTLGMDYLLPSDIAVGDRLYLAATGAYSVVYASNFGGFEAPRSYYLLEDGTVGDTATLMNFSTNSTRHENQSLDNESTQEVPRALNSITLGSLALNLPVSTEHNEKTTLAAVSGAVAHSQRIREADHGIGEIALSICDDPESPLWHEAEALEAAVFINCGYVSTQAELAAEYAPYLSETQMIALRVDGRCVGACRVIQYNPNVGFKTVKDTQEGRLRVNSLGAAILDKIVNSTETLEVGTIALDREYRKQSSLRLNMKLYSAIHGICFEQNKLKILANFDDEYLKRVRRYFGHAVMELGPSTEYMGSPTTVVIADALVFGTRLAEEK